jgi:hypothetical protein
MGELNQVRRMMELGSTGGADLGIGETGRTQGSEGWLPGN